jgi:thymidylate synthase
MVYFSILFACDKNNGGFSNENSLPFKLSKDMKYFKDITSKPYKKNCKNVLIMGKNTYYSKPSLNDDRRIEMVISNNSDKKDNFFKSFEECLEKLSTRNDIGKIFLIGGKNLIEKYYNNVNCEEILVSFLDFENFENKYDNFIDKSLFNSFYMISCKNDKDYCKLNNCNVYIEFTKYNKYKTSEISYINLINEVLDNGEIRNDRTGTGTISLFGPQIEIDISESFPLLTTKRLKFSNILAEVLWFLSGETNINFLKENGVNIWDGNTSREFLDKRGFYDYKEGDIGPLYGYQWRNFGGNFKDKNSKGVDQIERMLNLLKTDPTSRRIFMSAWNPVDLDKMALEPCHVSFQLYVSESEGKKYLSGKLYMRSNDLFLGAPWNIAGYSLLIYMFCHLTGYLPKKLIYSLGDAHIYSNHIKQVEEQMSRPLRPFPKLKIIKEGINNFEDFDMNSFELENYEPHSFIKADMAV